MKNRGIISVMSLLILISGCTTGEQSLKEGDKRSVVTTLSEQGITLSAQYLDKKMLYDRFGTRDNPFLEYKGNRLIVIEFTLSAGYEVRLRLSKVTFDYLNTLSKPVPRVDFSQYWERTLRNPGTASTGLPSRYRDWSYNRVLKVINENTLPDSLEIRPGPEYTGFMLFEGEEGKYGNAKITVPIYSAGGKKVHEFLLLVDI
jgi:hypothetical protein